MNEEMKIEINSLFKDIIKNPIDVEKCRLFVILNSIRYEYEMSSGGVGIADNTILYEVSNKHHNSYNDLRVVDVFNSIPQSPTHTINPFQTKKITDVLDKIHINDDKLLLITWDHGSGFGIFEEAMPTAPKELKPIYQDLDTYKYLKLFWDLALSHENMSHYSRRVQKNDRVFQVNKDIYRYVETNQTSAQVATLALNLLLSHQIQAAYTLYNQNKDKAEIDIDCTQSNNKQFSEVFTKKIEISNIPVSLSQATNITIDIEKINSREILQNSELAEIISHWLGKGKRVEVLLMMNCDVMSFHTLYSLKDVVHYIVAPQGTISIPGYNYRDILRHINKNPPNIVSPKNLAAYCVKSCHNKQAFKRALKLSPSKADSIKQWIIIAMDLSARPEGSEETFFDKILSDFFTIIKGLSDLLDEKTKKEELRLFFKHSRLFCIDHTHDGRLYFIDLISWLVLIYINGNSIMDDPLHASLINFTYFLLDSKITVEKYIGVNSLKSKYALGLEPSGLGIFFPLEDFNDDKQQSEYIINLLGKDQFFEFKEAIWKAFLKKVYPTILTLDKQNIESSVGA